MFPGLCQSVTYGIDDQRLDLVCGDARYGSHRIIRTAALQRLGDIIAVSHPVPGRVGRDHPVAGIVNQKTREKRFRFLPGSRPMGPLFGQFGLDGLEQRSLEQRRLRSGQDLALECHLADIEPVAQHIEQWALGERNAAPDGAARELANFGGQPFRSEIGDQAIDAAQFKVALENEADGSCFVRVDGELAVAQRIPERNHASDPQALAFGGGDLVADALGRDLAFELGEGQENIQGQPAHRCRRVELLGHRDE